jgi:type IV pilus assembly protein PilA
MKKTFYSLLSLLLIAGSVLMISCKDSKSVGSTSADPDNSFATVDAYLEQGGVLYGFVDVEGDLERIAKGANEMLTNLRSTINELAMVPQLPMDSIVEQLGLSSIRAIGMSSTEREQGFQNRTFLLTEGSPKGLLAMYGKENSPFLVPDLAPQDADIAVEQTLNTAALLDTTRDLASLLMGTTGASMIENYLAMPVPGSDLKVNELIAAIDGRMYLIADIDESATMEVPEYGTMPRIEFILRLESAAPLATKLGKLPALAAMPDFKMEMDGGLTVLSGFLPKNALYAPLIVGNETSGELFLCSSRAFYDSCLQGSSAKLKSSKAFAGATEGLPKSGYAFGYISPEVGSLLKELIDRSMEEAVKTGGQEAAAFRPYMNWSIEPMVSEFPMAYAGSVEANGLYSVANWNVSHKRNLATMAYANPVTIGLVAAMAIPAFQKVRNTSQEKTITNNLRQLASGADQYFLENGVTSVKTSELLGPNGYIRSFEPVAGETYPQEINTKMDKISATLPNGETVSISF